MGEQATQVCVFVYLSGWQRPRQPRLLGPPPQTSGWSQWGGEEALGLFIAF